MKIHCDNCGKYLGDYLHGKGGVEEKARIGHTTNLISMPNIICFNCDDTPKKPKMLNPYPPQIINKGI